jgi:CheY-like chemotaxis protein/two-component sensor histidine kinase
MLRTGRLEGDKQQRAYEVIERNAKAQAALIDDVLDVSRIVSGKLRLNIASVELAEVVGAAVDSLRPAAEAKQIRLRLRVEAELGRVSGDPDRLQQVVWNLLSNAVKFSGQGGQIDVAVARLPDAVQIDVTDEGRGIAPEFLPHVFEAFRQADAGSSRHVGGLGLGLAIVKHLVELHGGSVQAFSEGVGQGARFSVRLPLAPPTANARPVDPLTQSSTEQPGFTCPSAVIGLKLLVIDDEPDTRDVLAAVLEHCQARVLVAGSSSEGFELFVRERPDVVISDIGMPGEDGYVLIGKVRSLPPDQGGRTPAIALTAYARPEDRTRALARGFNHHVAKPVDPAELLVVIANLAEAFNLR